MFKIRWSTADQKGEALNAEAQKVQNKIMKQVNKQLKQDRMKAIETDKEGYTIYMKDCTISSGVKISKKVKDEAREMKRLEFSQVDNSTDLRGFGELDAGNGKKYLLSIEAVLVDKK